MSANFISLAGWTKLGKKLDLDRSMASNIPKWHYFSFLKKSNCQYFQWFDRLKKYHSTLWGSQALSFSSGEVENNCLVMCLLMLFTLCWWYAGCMRKIDSVAKLSYNILSWKSWILAPIKIHYGICAKDLLIHTGITTNVTKNISLIKISSIFHSM